MIIIRDKDLHKRVCCDPHLNCLVETVQMRGHNMVSVTYKKNCPSIIIKYPFFSRAL